MKDGYATLARVLRRTANLADALGAVRHVRDAPTDLRDAYSFVETFRYGELTLAPMQLRSEFEQLAALVAQHRPTRVVEIGTAKGGTLFMWTRTAAADATIVSIDQPGGNFGGSYTRAAIPVYKAFAKPRQTIRLIRADSHLDATRDKAAVATGGRPIDFLFIDGDHTYAGVHRDFELYSPLVRPGGLIALHDIVDGPDPSIGSPQLWRELRSSRQTIEFVADPSQGCWGIGLVFVD